MTLDVTLSYGGGGRTMRGRSVDLSGHGIFVAMEAEPPVGRRVDLVIDCPGVAARFATSGFVVHRVAGLGVGVRFEPKSAASCTALRSMVDRLKRSAAAATGRP